MQELFKENLFFTYARSEVEAWYICKLMPRVLKKPNWKYMGPEVRSFTPLWKVQRESAGLVMQWLSSLGCAVNVLIICLRAVTILFFIKQH